MEAVFQSMECVFINLTYYRIQRRPKNVRYLSTIKWLFWYKISGFLKIIVLLERAIFYDYKSVLMLFLRLLEQELCQFNKQVMSQLPEVGIEWPGEM